jgi:hypothetical protein
MRYHLLFPSWLIISVLCAACGNPFYDTPGAYNPADVTSITVTPPSKRLYNRGETLDLTGASVDIFYRGDPAKRGQSVSAVSGFDSNREGLQTLTVTIGGKTDAFDVAVRGITVTDEPTITKTSGASVTIVNSPQLGGSWKRMLFNGTALTKQDSGTGDTVTFTAPSAGTYTLLLVFSKDGYQYYRFYTLQVS